MSLVFGIKRKIYDFAVFSYSMTCGGTGINGWTNKYSSHSTKLVSLCFCVLQLIEAYEDFRATSLKSCFDDDFN